MNDSGSYVWSSGQSDGGEAGGGLSGDVDGFVG